MHKILLGIVLFGIFPAATFGSTSTVTATVTDTDGQVWSNGTWTAKLTLPSGPFGNTVPTIAGLPVPVTAKGTMNASGVLTALLTDTSSLDQSGGQWTLTACPDASITANSATGCATVTTAITGGTVNLSARFSGVTAPRFPPGSNAFGYLDVEVLQPSIPGDSYYNTGANVSLQGLRVWDGKQWSGVGGTAGGTAGGDLSGTYPNPAVAKLNGTPLSGNTGVVQDNAGTISISTALANNTTATTQAAGDSSTKVASDQFVQQNLPNPLEFSVTQPTPASTTMLIALRNSANQLVNILTIGDSFMICSFSNCGTNTGPSTGANRYLELIRVTLQKRYGNGGTGMYPLVFAVAATPAPVNPDGWSCTSYDTNNMFSIATPGPGLGAFSSVVHLGNGQSCTWNDNRNIAWTNFSLYYGTPGTTSSLALVADGTTSLGTADNAGATVTGYAGPCCGGAITMTTHRYDSATTLSSGPHSVVATCTGDCYLYAAQGRNATGVAISNLAIASGILGDWHTNNGSGNLPAGLAFQDLIFGGAQGVIEGHFGNQQGDAGCNTPANFTNCITSLATYERSLPSAPTFMIQVPSVGSQWTPTNAANYTAAIQSAINITGATSVNIQQRGATVGSTPVGWGTSYNGPNPLWNNAGSQIGIHPNDLGNADEAQQYYAGFFNSTGPYNGCNVGYPNTITPNTWLSMGTFPGCNVHIVSSLPANIILESSGGSSNPNFWMVNGNAAAGSRQWVEYVDTSGYKHISPRNDTNTGTVVDALSMSPVTGVTGVNHASGNVIPPSFPTNTLLWSANSNGTSGRITSMAFGATPFFSTYRADNTVTSPSAVTTNDVIGDYNANANDGTATSAAGAAIHFYAGEPWTSTHHGTYWGLGSTPTGSATMADTIRGYGSGGIAIGDTAFQATDPGAGILNVQSDIKLNGKTIVTTAASTSVTIANGTTLNAGTCSAAAGVTAPSWLTASSAVSVTFEVAPATVGAAGLVAYPQNDGTVPGAILCNVTAANITLTGDLKFHINIARGSTLY